MENKKYYIVGTKCGHVGRNKWIEINIPIIADSGKEAAFKARMTPRVKHHKKDAILFVKEVSGVEYLVCLKEYRKDPYVKCKNIQDQRMIENFNCRVKENEIEEREFRNKKESARFKNKKQQILIKEMKNKEKEYYYYG